MPTANRRHDKADPSKQQPAHWPQFAIDMWNPVSAAVGLWNVQLPGALAAVGQEWGDFVLRRLKEDAELPLQLAQSRTSEEFWARYAEFWTKLAADYRQEWKTLAELGNQRTQQSFEFFRPVATPPGEGYGNSTRN